MFDFRVRLLRFVVVLLGGALLAGCMNASLLHTGTADTAISIQQAPAGVTEIQLTISGPGMSTISRTLTPDTDSLILEIPIGPDRVFEASAGGYSARVVRAVTAGGVTVRLSLWIAAEGTLLFARGTYQESFDTGSAEVINADVYTIDASGSNEQQLTNFDGSISGAIWTPDGTWALFISGEDFYRVRADGSEQLALPTDGTQVPKIIGGFEPNGTRLAYAYETGNGPAVFTVDVGAQNPAETTIRTSAGFDYSLITLEELLSPGAVDQDVVAAWSPDGASLLYSREDNGGGGLAGRLYVTSDGGQSETAISVGAAAAVSAQWLPVGSAVVYAQTDTDVQGAPNADDMDIYIAEYNDSTGTVTSTTQLTDTDALDRNLRISPDGTAVLFERHDTVTGANQYFVVDVSTGDETPVTDAASFQSGFLGFYPSWIAGTNEIAILGFDFSTEAVQIRIYSSTGAELDVIENTQLETAFPSQWSANGAAASVMLDESGEAGEGDFDLYLLSRTTGELSPITDTPEAEIGGYWRP